MSYWNNYSTCENVFERFWIMPNVDALMLSDRNTLLWKQMCVTRCESVYVASARYAHCSRYLKLHVGVSAVCASIQLIVCVCGTDLNCPTPIRNAKQRKHHIYRTDSTPQQNVCVLHRDRHIFLGYRQFASDQSHTQTTFAKSCLHCAHTRQCTVGEFIISLYNIIV